MALKIGELARRSGLTVRTLHHYDAIGLLRPSARSEAGYRLYSQDDIARLHRIQALRRFGMSLADIGVTLNRPDLSPAALLARQIDALTQEISRASGLRARLVQMHAQLQQGQEPGLTDWLATLEDMSMYDKYFTQEELDQLPLYTQADTLTAEWRALVGEVQALMAAGVSPADPQAQALAQRWMQKIKRDTGGNPVLFAKLNAMHEREPAVQAQTGITPALMQFVIDASHESKLALYSKYVTPEELAFMRANIGKRAAEWPPLIAQVRAAMDGGVAPGAPQAQALMRQWFALFRSFAGDDPATQQRVRDALTNEPGLTDDGMVDGAMREYIGAAMGAMRRAG